MTKQTKQALTNLSEAIKLLTVGVLIHTGMETASKVCSAAQEVIIAVKNEPEDVK